jgi:hypothetical protein
MRNGDVFVLYEWRGEGDGEVVGQGTHYNRRREAIDDGLLRVPVDSVALFETNVLETSGAGTALTIFAAVTAGVAVICALNPKACFGSCPTFYIDGVDRPVAEGFSASISPSLEATDVDALEVARGDGGRFEVVMKNEAYETHVVRHVNLLALPRRPGARVFASLDGSYWETFDVRAPVLATGPEGDCLTRVRASDGVERFSLADSTNLAHRETIELVFADPPRGDCGLVVGCRQTLMSTYLLYQTFAYMGSEAGHWIAELERGRLRDAGGAIVDLLGGVVVRVESSPEEWTTVGELREFGPIATDHHLVVFDAPAQWTGRVRLEMTKGAWRVDDVALAALAARVEPVRIVPDEVRRDGADDEHALAILFDPARSLTTLPGDTYTLVFDLPGDGREYELLLESRGYYLEWIREEWIAEENPARLYELFLDPATALARLAPEFKKVEPHMERAFWGSRYAKP